MGEKNKDTKFKDKVSDSEELEELEELEEKDSKAKKDQDKDKEEKTDRDSEKKKNTNEKEKDEKKSSKKEEKEDLLDEEDESFGTKVVVAIVVIAIIVVLLLKACSGKTEEYKVTFDSNGGSNVAVLTIKEDGTATKPADPTKSGYVFAGWYYNDELYDFNTKITGDIKLEARWNEVGDTDVTGVTLDRRNLSLLPGSTATLVATVAPTSATNKSLTWKSSDTSIATVDANGIVTAVKEGTATITVTTVDGSYTATCTVTISKDNVAVTGVSLNKTSLTLAVNESSTVTATVTPSGATNKNVTWSSDNTKVATVSSKGVITGKADGTAVITVTTEDGKYTASVTVTVKTVAVTGVSLNKGTTSIVEGKTETLKATIKPTNASNKTVTWSSSNTAVATVDANGKITAKSVGTTVITVTTKDGKYTAQCTVTVTEKTYKYTYKTAKLQADEFSPIYYKVWIYRDGIDITTSVTRISSPFIGTQKESGYFKITDSHYSTLNGGSLKVLYNGETLTVTKG